MQEHRSPIHMTETSGRAFSHHPVSVVHFPNVSFLSHENLDSGTQGVISSSIMILWNQGVDPQYIQSDSKPNTRIICVCVPGCISTNIKYTTIKCSVRSKLNIFMRYLHPAYFNKYFA